MQKSFFDQQKKGDRNTEFSDLLVIQKDMKDIFRKLVRQDIRFKKSLEQSHNKFYKKIFKEKRALIYDEEDVTFVNDYSKQIKKSRYQNSAPLSKERQQYKETDKLGTLEKGGNKGKKDTESQTINRLQQPQSKQTSTTVVNRSKVIRIDDDYSKGNDNNIMLKALYDIYQQDIKPLSNEVETEIKLKSKDEIREEEHHEQVQMLLTDDIITSLKQYEFTKLIQNQKILDDVAHKIYEKDPLRIKDQQHFKQSLKYCDKNLFVKFRDNMITYDQLLARVEEKRFGTKYMVLDDLKGTIEAEFIRDDKDDAVIQRALKFVEKNNLKENERDFLAGKRCVRSLFSKVDKKEVHLNNSMDIIMRENHRKEVKQNKDNRQQQMYEHMIGQYDKRQQRHASAEEKLKKVKDEETQERMAHGKIISREEDAKYRQQKFNQRLKNSLKEYFLKYKSQMMRQTPQTTNLEVQFIEQQLKSELRAKANQSKEETKAETIFKKPISKQFLLKQKRKEEIEQRKQNKQQMLFINRLVEDGQNVLTEQRRKILNNMGSSMQMQLNSLMDQQLGVASQKAMLESLKDKKNFKTRLSSRVSQNSVISTATQQEPHTQQMSQEYQFEDYPKVQIQNDSDLVNKGKIMDNSGLDSRPKSLLTHRNNNAKGFVQSQGKEVSEDFKRWYQHAIERHQMPNANGANGKFFNMRMTQDRSQSQVDNDSSIVYGSNNKQRFSSVSYAPTPFTANFSPNSSIQEQSQIDYKTHAIISRLANKKIKEIEFNLNSIFLDESYNDSRPKTHVYKKTLKSSDIMKQYQQEFVVENMDR